MWEKLCKRDCSRRDCVGETVLGDSGTCLQYMAAPWAYTSQAREPQDRRPAPGRGITFSRPLRGGPESYIRHEMFSQCVRPSVRSGSTVRHFHCIGPLGQFSLYVAMSGCCLCVCGSFQKHRFLVDSTLLVKEINNNISIQ